MDIGKEDEEYYTGGQQNIRKEDDKILDRRKSENYEGGNSIRAAAFWKRDYRILDRRTAEYWNRGRQNL
jgi:hypothetical protein